MKHITKGNDMAGSDIVAILLQSKSWKSSHQEKRITILRRDGTKISYRLEFEDKVGRTMCYVPWYTETKNNGLWVEIGDMHSLKDCREIVASHYMALFLLNERLYTRNSVKPYYPDTVEMRGIKILEKIGYKFETNDKGGYWLSNESWRRAFSSNAVETKP